MARTGAIGTKMNRKPPPVVNGKLEKDGYKLLQQWIKEAQDRLEALITKLGAATATSLAATGAVSGASVSATGAVSGASLAITGNGTIGGTLGVTGATTLAGATTGALSASALTTAESDIHHAERTVTIGALDGQNASATAANLNCAGLRHWASTSAGTIVVPIDLAVGDRLTGGYVWVLSSASGGPTFKLFKRQLSNTTDTQLGATQTATAAATKQKLTITGLTEVIAVDFTYLIEVTLPFGTQAFYGGAFTYDRP